MSDSVKLNETLIRGRISKAETRMKIAEAWSEQSTCPRGRAGCLIVDAVGRTISTGYNGAPRRLPHCLEDGCILESTGDGHHCIRSVHAEINAIIFATQSLERSHVYCTIRPCIRCTIALIQAGVWKITYKNLYASDSAKDATDLCRQAGVEVYQIVDGEEIRQR